MITIPGFPGAEGTWGELACVNSPVSVGCEWKSTHSACSHLAHETEMIITVFGDPVLLTLSERVGGVRAKVGGQKTPGDEDVANLGLKGHIEWGNR